MSLDRSSIQSGARTSMTNLHSPCCSRVFKTGRFELANISIIYMILGLTYREGMVKLLDKN